MAIYTNYFTPSLSIQHSVILVDCDLYNYGATLWLQDLLEPDQHKSLCFSELIGSFDSTDTGLKSVDLLCKNRELSLIDVPNTVQDQFFFVPSIIPFSPLQAKLNMTLQGDREEYDRFSSLTADNYKSVLNRMIGRFAERKHPSFIILDCHPGYVPITTACSALANCNIIVTDYEKTTIFSSIVFAWLVESELRNNKDILDLKWRFAVNKLPSSDLFGESKMRISEDVKRCEQMEKSLSETFPSLSGKATEHFGAPIIEIPDLEEFRVLEGDREEHPLSSRRRGGNGFVLSVKAMLRKLEKQGFLGRNLDGYTFHKIDLETEAAFESLPHIYFPSRGIGKQGLSTPMFWLTLTDLIVLVTYLVLRFWPESGFSKLTYVKVIPEILLLLSNVRLGNCMLFL